MERETLNTNIQNSLSLQSRIASFGRALTAKELAGLLNVSPVTVFKQAKKGLIPSFRIGTCVRFEPKKTAEWLSRQ
jgi:excisionase family DNA binding protein